MKGLAFAQEKFTAPPCRCAANPAQVLWASDWPPPFIPVPMPNDADLLDTLFDWADNDDALIGRILVDNPARLCGF